MLVQRVLTRGGVLRPHVNLFLNDSDVRAVGGLDATLQDGDTLTVVPSVSGG
jgi:molybdopterin converting factor small subunit